MLCLPVTNPDLDGWQVVGNSQMRLMRTPEFAESDTKRFAPDNPSDLPLPPPCLKFEFGTSLPPQRVRLHAPSKRLGTRLQENGLCHIPHSSTISTKSSFVSSNTFLSSPKLHPIDDHWYTTSCDWSLEGLVMVNPSRRNTDKRSVRLSTVIRALHERQGRISL